MKKMKKILLLVTCAFVLLGTTACGSRNDADNGADQSSQDGNVRDENSNVNDATKGDGIIDDAHCFDQNIFPESTQKRGILLDAILPTHDAYRHIILKLRVSEKMPQG